VTVRIVLVGAALVATGVATLDAQEAPRRRVFPVPILGYAPETSLQIGLAVVGVASGVRTDPGGPAPRPTTGLAVAVYTLKHQYQFSLSVDRWTSHDRWHLTGDLGLERFPSQFHGIGAAATDSSETYTPQRASFSASVQRRLTPRVFVGAGYALRHTRMVETEVRGRLAPGTIPGSRGGTEAIATVDGVWDSRDALFMTRRGGYVRLALGAAGRVLGGDHAYRRYTADARAFRGVGGRIVLAAQAFVDATDGTVPFELLPSLGGQNILRGYTVPRFRDGTMSALQGEVRAPVAGIVGVVLFAGVGAVAPSVRAIPDAPFRVTGGLGARFVLDRREGLQLRMDYAFARGGGGFYVAAGDAF
jgi:outer membrane protein assembly factor BamA